MTSFNVSYECIKPGEEHLYVVKEGSEEQIAIEAAITQGGLGFCQGCCDNTVARPKPVDVYNEAQG